MHACMLLCMTENISVVVTSVLEVFFRIYYGYSEISAQKGYVSVDKVTKFKLYNS
jgi:hypothetical protein